MVTAREEKMGAIFFPNIVGGWRRVSKERKRWGCVCGEGRRDRVKRPEERREGGGCKREKKGEKERRVCR